MANTILAFDEHDNLLGVFFQACKDDLNVFFETTAITPTHINSRTLNDLAINVTIEKYKSFIFGAYSHADQSSLATINPWRPYISIELNGHHFKNSFFYTFSCSSGKEFGKDVIEQGCLCFIGYKAPIFIWSTYIKPFVNCANYGLKQFLTGQNTSVIIEQMTECYNNEIDAIYKKDYLIASILRENRDELIIHGSHISLTDLIAN